MEVTNLKWILEEMILVLIMCMPGFCWIPGGLLMEDKLPDHNLMKITHKISANFNVKFQKARIQVLILCKFSMKSSFACSQLSHKCNASLVKLFINRRSFIEHPYQQTHNNTHPRSTTYNITFKNSSTPSPHWVLPFLLI